MIPSNLLDRSRYENEQHILLIGPLDDVAHILAVRQFRLPGLLSAVKHTVKVLLFLVPQQGGLVAVIYKEPDLCIIRHIGMGKVMHKDCAERYVRNPDAPYGI